MGLPVPLAQGNEEIDQLLIESVLKSSEFHKKHHVNSKGLKKEFSITWQKAKGIIKRCTTCSFYTPMQSYFVILYACMFLPLLKTFCILIQF